MSTTTSASASATPTGNRAPSQGGVIEGANPSVYNPKDPITIFIIQAGIIIIVCYLLHWPLSKIRQPRVIAEVIGGIILGPSVMGRIPGFRAAIFPAESLPNLTLVANLGLVLYLFLIGLETDVPFLLKNWRVATSVAFAGMALPFGLGCALAWGLYHQFSEDEGLMHIQFGVFMLFVGVAIAITAFPVLCRILTELRLLDTEVGVITLSAGVANDVVGWILLALCVALVNAGSGLSSLWILLSCVGYLLFLLYVVKPCLMWVLRRTGSLENGPSQSVIALILVVTLASAFFTGIIGVHAIFGGFMVGLILPRDNGFNIRVTEKLEDLIGAIFLPLYFTLSGLNTNLGLLDNGITWAYVIAVTLVAFFSKLIGASLAARLNGLIWRESWTIGILMSCKGLVELIVLNIGLQARILSTRTFTIFVVMALLTTFATTPLALTVYPPKYQRRFGAIPGDGEALAGRDSAATSSADVIRPGSERVRRLLVYLRLDNMPAILGLVSLFGLPPTSEPQRHPLENEKRLSKEARQSVAVESLRPVRAHGFRLVQLTDRDSSVMAVAQADEYSRFDPVVNIFRTLGQLSKLSVSGEVAVLPENRFAEALVNKSADMASDLLLVPWGETGSLVDAQVLSSETVSNKLGAAYTQFVRTVLQTADRDVAVFLSKSQGPERSKLNRAYSFSDMQPDNPNVTATTKAHHIFLPYFGGADDRLALALVLQLCERADVTATVVYVPPSPDVAKDDHFAATAAELPAKMAPRVRFETATIANRTDEVLDRAAAELRASAPGTTWYNLVVLGRRAGQQRPDGRLAGSLSDEVRECLGAVAGHLVASKLNADLLVVQARAVHEKLV